MFTNTKFGHVCIAGGIIILMASVALMNGHMTQTAHIQTMGSIIGTIVLTAMISNFK